jgi:hypothetical protein
MNGSSPVSQLKCASAPLPAVCCDAGGADAWPACVGPRVSVGGLQRACRLPTKQVSCPLLGTPRHADGGHAK